MLMKSHFLYQRMGTKSRFEKQAYSKITYLIRNIEERHCYKPTNPVGGVLPQQLGAASQIPLILKSAIFPIQVMSLPKLRFIV